MDRGLRDALCGAGLRLYPWDRVRVAERARRRTPWDADPRTLCAAAGVLVVPLRSTAGCGGELTDGVRVGYRWHPDRRERGLRVLHGLAHALLCREGWQHEHGDVWLLTCELALPRSAAGLEIEELVERAHLPEDVVRAWAPLARSLGRRWEAA